MARIDLSTKIGKMNLRNPIILASGTAGFGEELRKLININVLGALVTKTVTLNEREGNPPPRIAETASGLLNSIGLDNDGLKHFMLNEIPRLEKLELPIIVSIAGDNVDEFVALAEELSRPVCIKAIEINLSCPNVIYKSAKFPILAQDRKAVERVISKVRKATKLTLISKLSPNVTDIKEIAKTAQSSGSDAISLVNTFPGMAVDAYTLRPKLGAVSGGLSGPCIKPLALKCVWEVYNAVDIPIIGIGGIMNAEDAIEFIICGASAVQIGTANFVNPKVSLEILDGVKAYLKKKKTKSATSLVGALKV